MTLAAPPPLTEKQFQRQIVDYAKLRGWKVAWVWNSLHSPKGWPDLFMCRGDKAVALEVKSDAGKVTGDQSLWLWALCQVVGIEARVARPSRWDEIEALLS